jgi:hypothetical protein
MMAGVLFLTQSQALDLFGFNMFAMRFLELAGFARVVARREFSFSGLNPIDRAMLLLYTFTPIVYVLRASEGQTYVVGAAVDAVLCYFTFRGLIGNIEDFKWFLDAFILLLAPYAALLLLETLTAHVPFRVLGAEDIGWAREGRPRCIGSFRNPTLLGTLGASFLPLYIGSFLAQTARRRLSLAGIGLCIFIVWSSNSGGSAACAGVGMLGWLLWRLRAKMYWVRRSVAVGIFLLALVMKAPVWYLLARVSSITGGDGYHRAHLLDMAFQRLGRWWFAGMPVKDTADWFPYVQQVTGGADMTNYFLAFGITAGLGSMILFVLLLKRTFSMLGIALARSRSTKTLSAGSDYILWGLGVMLAAHIFNWLGITYFDQTQVYWYMQLAAISNLSGTWAPEVGSQAEDNVNLEVADTPLTTQVPTEGIL